MKFLKKIWAWEKAQLKKTETHAAIGMAGGMLIGISQDNYGLGVALALALGTGVYVTGKKMRKEEVAGTSEETIEINRETAETEDKQ